MINVYPNALDSRPIESHKITGSTTIYKWLVENVDGYDHNGTQLFAVAVDGDVVNREDWDTVAIDKNSVVDIRVVPQGVGLIIGAVISLALVSAAFLILTRKPKISSMSRDQGKDLEAGMINANVPRFNQVIPESFGETVRYPDLLLPVYRRFDEWPNPFVIPNTVTQSVSVLTCLGVGEYEIKDVWVGDTPPSKLGGRFQYAQHAPGARLSEDNAYLYDWWHTPDEVGFTAFGGAGIELKGGTGGGPSGNLPEWIPNSSATVTNNRLSVTEPYDPVPFQWLDGMETRVEVLVHCDVTTDATGFWVKCDLLDNLNGFGVGDEVELVKTLDGNVNSAGTYTVGAVGPLGYRLSSNPSANLMGSGLSVIGMAGLTYTISNVSNDGFDITPKGLSTWDGFPEGVHNVTSDQLVFPAYGDSKGGDGWAGPFSVTPDGLECDIIELDFMFPQGWGKYDDKSRLQSLTGTVEINVKGEGIDRTYSRTFSGKTANQIGFTFRIDDIAPGSYEVSCRANPGPRGSSTYLDRIEWSGLKSRMYCKPEDYPNVTTVSATLKTGNDIGSGVEDKIRIRAVRKLQDHHGEGSLEPTREAMPVLSYILRDVGCDPAVIDYPAIDRIHDYALLTGRKFDGSYSSSTTVKDALSDVLDVCMSHLTIVDGKLSGVIEKRHDGLMQGKMPLPSRVLSAWQMTSPMVETITTPQPDDPDGVDVEYVDRLTGKTEVYPYRLAGDAGIRATKVTIKGVSNRAQAKQMASRLRRRQIHQRASYTVTTEMQGLNINFMDLIGLQDIIPIWGQASPVTSLLGNKVIVADDIYDPLTTTTVAFSKPDGTITETFNVTRINGRELTLSTSPTIDIVPIGGTTEPTLVYMGQEDEFLCVARVMSVEPSGDGRVTIKAVNYDERIYAEEG